MKISRLAILLAFLGVHSYAEEIMPWERPTPPTPPMTQEEREASAARASSHVVGLKLEEVILRGTLRKKAGDRFALLETPDGSVVFANVGTEIGGNSGVLSAIRDREIEITEQVPICGTSKISQRLTVMRIDERVPAGTTLNFELSGGNYVCSQD